jgi:hypothetical protein
MWIATSGSHIPGTSNRFFSRSPSLSIAMAAPDHTHASRTESGRLPYGSTTSLLPVCTERDLVSTRFRRAGVWSGELGPAASGGEGSRQAMDPTSLASSHRYSTCRLSNWVIMSSRPWIRRVWHPPVGLLPADCRFCLIMATVGCNGHSYSLIQSEHISVHIAFYFLEASVVRPVHVGQISSNVQWRIY